MTIFKRIAAERYSEILPNWRGRTAVLIGGGPSLSAEQIAVVEDARHLGALGVIAINDAYLLAPWADVCYFADAHWWRWHTEGIAKPRLGLSADQVRQRFADFAGAKCSIQSSGGDLPDPRVHIMKNRDHPNHGLGLSLDPQLLCTGWNGGFQALNIAVLAGCRRVILLGYDGAPDRDGRSHFHGSHPRPTPEAAWAHYRRAMSAAEHALAAAGVAVLNCSPGSAIDSFPKVELIAALSECLATA